MTRHPQDNEGLLRTLLAGGVDFAIVGGPSRGYTDDGLNRITSGRWSRARYAGK